jgi:hypothetical protein
LLLLPRRIAFGVALHSKERARRMQGCCMQARCERIDYNDVQICAIVLLYVQVQ